MSVGTQIRKPLGVRATPEQHRLIVNAAAREHRSVASFVLNAALKAAKTEQALIQRARTPEQLDAALDRAQELMKPYRRPGHSLVDELLAERRAEASRE